VKARLDIYHKETEPLKGFYAERGLLRSVDDRPTVAETSKGILDVLGR
jgi:adenylate kinase